MFAHVHNLTCKRLAALYQRLTRLQIESDCLKTRYFLLKCTAQLELLVLTLMDQFDILIGHDSWLASAELSDEVLSLTTNSAGL